MVNMQQRQDSQAVIKSQAGSNSSLQSIQESKDELDSNEQEEVKDNNEPRGSGLSA